VSCYKTYNTLTATLLQEKVPLGMEIQTSNRTSIKGIKFQTLSTTAAIYTLKSPRYKLHIKSPIKSESQKTA